VRARTSAGLSRERHLVASDLAARGLEPVAIPVRLEVPDLLSAADEIAEC